MFCAEVTPPAASEYTVISKTDNFLRKDTKMKSVVVLGGDMRGVYCAGRLSREKGYNVVVSGLKGRGEGGKEERLPERADILVLPYVSLISGKDGRMYISSMQADKGIAFETAAGLVKGGTAVFCGRLPEQCAKELTDRGAKLYDWFSDEELTLKNAALTAEGAAQIITGESKDGVGGSNILILGCGRVARACAKLFRSMGGSVTIAARKESDRMFAVSQGWSCAALDDIEAWSRADVIVNTIPARVIGEKELRSVKPGGWILELASKPYGLDFEEAERLGVRAVLGSGLPGKFTPEAAGENMACYVIKAAGGDLSE